MTLGERRFGRRDVATMAAAASVLPGAVTLGLTDEAGRTAAAFAQPATPPPVSLSGAPMVYVGGHGSVRAQPDMASAVIGVEVERETLAEAQSEATALASAVIAAIQAAGVADEDIRTSSFTVRMVREREREEDGGRGERGEIRGFQVANAVEVTVRALDTLGQVLDDAIAAGANEVRQINLFLADPTDAASQARTRAVEDARAKADALAAAAGLTVSRVVSMTEFLSPVPVSANGGTAIADAAGGMERTAVPIAVGADEIVVEIDAAFELA